MNEDCYLTITGGNVGRDPEIRMTQGGKKVATFSVAANFRYTNSAGEKVDETLWVRCTAWEGLATVVENYVRKGREVTIKGRPQFDPATGGPKIWTDQNGASRASFELTVGYLKLHGSRGSNGSEESAAAEEVAVPEDAF